MPRPRDQVPIVFATSAAKSSFSRLDALAEREADERVDLHLAAELLAELEANLLDGARGRIPHVVLPEERHLGEPLGDLAVEDLRPRRLGLALFLELRREDLLLLVDRDLA